MGEVLSLQGSELEALEKALGLQEPRFKGEDTLSIVM